MFTEECRKAHKVSDDEVKQAMAGNVPDSQNAKCAAACLMKQYKIVKKKTKLRCKIQFLI